MRGYFVEVSEEVKNNAERCVREIDCEMTMIVRSSNHDDDERFYVVVGYKNNGSAYPYCVWEFNSEDNGRLMSGFYDMAFDSALMCVAELINYCTGERFKK